MAADTVEESTGTLKYKTWILKVSVHCEGCKKKVKKILHNVEGVYEVDVDVKQQRAIVTGNVEPDTLIKRLMKYGKNAQLWPQKLEPEKNSGKTKSREKIQSEPEKNSGKTKNKENKQSDPIKAEDQSSKGTATSSLNKKELNLPEKSESVQEPSKGSDGAGAANAGAGVREAKSNDDVADKNGGHGKVSKEIKSEEKKTETVSAGSKIPVAAEEKDGEIATTGGPEESGGGEGNKGKTKKKKGQDGNNHNNVEGLQPIAVPADAADHYTGPPPVSVQTNHSPPRLYHHQYPTRYIAPQPVYATTSYSTAQPGSSYTTSYYFQPQQPYSYRAYSHPGSETEQPPPLDVDAYYPPQPLDSFEMFSDENPNGCLIM